MKLTIIGIVVVAVSIVLFVAPISLWLPILLGSPLEHLRVHDAVTSCETEFGKVNKLLSGTILAECVKQRLITDMTRIVMFTAVAMTATGVAMTAAGVIMRARR